MQAAEWGISSSVSSLEPTATGEPYLTWEAGLGAVPAASSRLVKAAGPVLSATSSQSGRTGP